MDGYPQNELERLGAQTEWLRALARRIVSDSARADDLAQEAFLVALRRPSKVSGSVKETRAWLHGVVRNLARTARRTDGRRADRERGYARVRASEWNNSSQGAPDRLDDVVAQADRAKRLFEAVLELDEPYRTAILLAYGERLKAPAIAARTGVTPVAVRKRISRGVKMLRAELGADTDRASDPAWLLALATPTEAVSSPSTLVLTGTTMATKWILATAAVVLATGLGLWAWSTADGSHSSDGIAADVIEVFVGDEVQEFASSENGDLSSNRSSVEVEGATLPPADKSPGVLRGRVLLREDERPVADARVYRNSSKEIDGFKAEGEPLAVTDQSGRFEIVFESSSDQAMLDGGLWVVHHETLDVHVDPSRISLAENHLLEVRTLPLGQVDLLVVDEEGEPAPGVRIACEYKPVIGSDEQLWAFQGSRAAGTSGADGRLTVTGLPVQTSISFGRQGEWKKPTKVVIDPITRRAEVTLEFSQWSGLTVMLERSDGAPAVDVRVQWVGTPGRSGSMRPMGGRSDSEGRFLMGGFSAGRGYLEICGPGYHRPIHARLAPGETADLGKVVLDDACEITGRVATSTQEFAPALAALRVVALKGGLLVAETNFEADRSFSLMVPPGPLTVALSTDFDWNPILPFRGDLLGSVAATAPADDIELVCLKKLGALVGLADVSGGEPSVEIFREDSNVAAFGRAFPIQGAVGTEWESSRFRILGSADELIRAHVTWPDDRAAYSEPFRWTAGSTVDLGEMTPGLGVVVVDVSDSSGAPVNDVVVTMKSVGEDEKEVRTMDDGSARFELEAGPYAVRADSESSSSGPWQLVHVVGGSSPSVSLSLGRSCLLAGRMVSPDGPVDGVTLKAQRERPISNLVRACTSSTDGSFAFQPLQPGTYRYWVAGELVGRVELKGGESDELVLEIEGERRQVEILSAGKPIPWAAAMTVSQLGPEGSLWYRGDAVGPGLFEVRLPDGPLEFAIDPHAVGNNQLVFVAADESQDSGRYRLDLPDTGVELKIYGAAAHSPRPTGYLAELDGEPPVTSWGSRPEVYSEDEGIQSDGSRLVRFPFLNPGARVELHGLDSTGARRIETVVVGSGSWTPVRWDPE